MLFGLAAASVCWGQLTCQTVGDTTYCRGAGLRSVPSTADITLQLAEAERARQEAERLRLENQHIRQQQQDEQSERIQDQREERAQRQRELQPLFNRYWREISEARQQHHNYTALVWTETALKVFPRNAVLRLTRKELKAELSPKGWHVIAPVPASSGSR